MVFYCFFFFILTVQLFWKYFCTIGNNVAISGVKRYLVKWKNLSCHKNCFFSDIYCSDNYQLRKVTLTMSMANDPDKVGQWMKPNLDKSLFFTQTWQCSLQDSGYYQKKMQWPTKMQVASLPQLYRARLFSSFHLRFISVLIVYGSSLQPEKNPYCNNQHKILFRRWRSGQTVIFKSQAFNWKKLRVGDEVCVWFELQFYSNM